ncbi:MAG: hypothetical protein J7K89_09820 [Candidatus Cloacimonetes bacterium]|nr:hypothetical protein [Candidatus Cloacimonadota bacterium]
MILNPSSNPLFLYDGCGGEFRVNCFLGDSRGDVDTFTAELRAREVTILCEDRHPYAGGKGYYAVYFEYPDGMKVEIVADEE